MPISSNFYFGTAILGPILKISAISEGPSLSKASGAHANGYWSLANVAPFRSNK